MTTNDEWMVTWLRAAMCVLALTLGVPRAKAEDHSSDQGAPSAFAGMELSYAGPVGFYALEVGVDIANALLWFHAEMSAQFAFAEDLFVRPHVGLSSAIVGWGLNGCDDCSEAERGAKTSGIFGSIWDPYFGASFAYVL